ncbi:MAG TPA: DUF4190 domain-containing protein [Pseudonocardia sp.]|jgi:hypothetical protein|nr:DUF4190 domain-containing protein [Pseudonocardia sp.]
MSNANQPGHDSHPGYYGTRQSYAPQQGYAAQQSYAYQPGYGTELGYAPPYSPTPTNTMAVLSLVLAFLFPPAGVIVGLVARSQLKRSNEQGDGLATAAIILSAIFTAAILLAVGSMVMVFLHLAASAQ